MATKRTWLWIVLGFVGFCLLILFAIAGAGIYFVSSRIDTQSTTSEGASRAFTDAKASFKDQRPLYELDTFERAKVVRQTTEFPTSSTKPRDLWILAWDPREERLVKISLPFWLLRLGKQKVDLMDHDQGFDFDRLNLDFQELERIGPVIILDFRSPKGERVLLWTQ